MAVACVPRGPGSLGRSVVASLATRGVRVARETGALTLLPGMVNFLAALHVHSGEFAQRRGG